MTSPANSEKPTAITTEPLIRCRPRYRAISSIVSSPIEPQEHVLEWRLLDVDVDQIVLANDFEQLVDLASIGQPRLRNDPAVGSETNPPSDSS